VCIVTVLWAGQPSDCLFAGRTRIACAFCSVRTSSGPLPASYSVGTGVLFLGVKQLGHEADF
jgi:hypothetical protein